jgi:hypothetical protein
VVERGGLENRCTRYAYRGFESHPLRLFFLSICFNKFSCLLYSESGTKVAFKEGRFRDMAYINPPKINITQKRQKQISF